ncbi:MAG: HipA domain-containing protein [bacterium]|nr:HipA domain-containing protein [bacterium]
MRRRDAHARNYSFLLTGNEARLSPLYDLHSSLPYVARGVGEREMAMRYGSTFTVYSAGSDHALLDVAARLGLPERRLLDRAEDLVSGASTALEGEVTALSPELQDLPEIERLLRRLGRRVVGVERTIEANRRRLREPHRRPR